jgi:two-component system chemotaxis sensor kinase CheA
MPEITFDSGMMAEFSDEFAGKLGELNHLLIEAERGGDGAARITEMFRAAHSLKGLAALAGLQGASAITHNLESVFERVRSGASPFTSRVSDAGFSACDHLQRILDEFVAGGAEATDIAPCLALLQATADGAAETGHDDDALIRGATIPAAEEALPAPQAGRPAHDLEMLRVDPARLDVVLNVSSELMVARAQLGDQVRRLSALAAAIDVESLAEGAPGDDERRRSLERLREAQASIEALELTSRTVHRLTSTMQSEAMRLRMVPVGPLFRRFERVLRDACRATGHEARLAISGERTELDKKLVDQLIDPLTHLIRNAVDHGLESPAERSRFAKSKRGIVRLEATHESGRVVIRVSDDGRGIDPVRLRATIAAKGLLPADQAERLSDRDAIDWIFASGFSTAERVTDISGRGVGLDIVRSRIAALSGTVEVESQVGAGTTFVIRLPLTLAMVRSLLVEAGGARYALPLHSVREVVRADPSKIRRVAGTQPHLEVRRELTPLVELGHANAASGSGWAVLARTKEERGVAILVDRVIREEELVVKPIPPHLRKSNGASGAAVLGDGDIALFIDVAPLLAHRAERARRLSA